MPLLNSPNHFLASLSAQDSELLYPHLKSEQFPQGNVLYGAEDTIERVYFPHTGVISLVVGLTTGQFVEAGMLGRNSVIGAAAPLDGAIALNRAIAQVGSAGMAAETAVLKRLVKESETLRTALVRNDQSASAQTLQVAACNALHELEERLSRWLLQTRDLLRSDTLPLTQEFLSQMLGVQRSSVTLVARKLQEAGLINYRRGRIHVLDVEGLQDSCCECYGAINAHFQRLIGWSPDGKASERKADWLFRNIFALCGIPDELKAMARVEPAKGFSVARYFFHIKDGADLIKDQEGAELPTAHAARLQALLSARELWADAIRSGKPLGADAVVIADERGGTLTFVPMNEALPKRPSDR